MKKNFTKHFILLAIWAFSISLSEAQQLLVQDFNFTGNLSSNGWTAITVGGGTNALSTTTGLTYPGFSSSGIGNAALVNNLGGEDANISFTSQSTDGQNVYLSAMVNITDASATRSGDYFLHLGTPGGAVFTTFAARIFARITATGVNFGLSNTSTATYGTTNFAKNTTYLLIMKYTISVAGNDPVSLWVIPTGVPPSEAAAGTPEITNTATAGTNAINTLALRQGSASNSVQTVVDGIIVGQTWADVASTGSVGPTLSAGGNITNLSTGAGTASTPQSFNLSGSNLTGFPSDITVTASANLEVSLTSGSGYATSILVPYTSATLASTPIYTRIAATAPQGAINGTVTSSGGGAAANAVVTVTGAVIQNYYNTKSNAGLTNVATWSTTTDGTGPSPADFVSPYQYFNIINQTNTNYSGVWDVSNAGNTARIIVGNGTNPITLTVLPGIDSITAASRVDVLNNGILVIQNNARPFLNNLATGSTVDFAQTGLTTSDTIKVAALSYHNLKLTAGIKILSGGVTTVRGNLIVDAVQNFNGAPSPFSTVNAFGDLNFLNGTTFEPVATGDANRFTLSMNGSNGEQYINGNGTEIFLFRLGRDTITSDMDIFLGANTNLTLGNATGGGGLRLNQGGATFTNLVSTGNTIKFARGAVSTATSNGKLNTANTNIVIEKANGTSYAGVLRFAPSSTLNNLTLNFDAAITKDSIAIADDIVINGALTLTKGRVVVAAGKSINMAIGSTLTGGNTASFIEGTLKRAGTNLLFPVGKGFNYAPVQLANMTGTNAYSVNYSNTGYGNYTVDPATLVTYPAYNVSKYLYWNITPDAAGSTDITFNYTDASSTVLVPNQIRIAHFDNTDWNDLGGTPAGGNTTTNGSVTVTGVNTFSPFTFGAIAEGVLPVKLSSFAVQKSGSTSRISWTTSQELNSKEFVIERSANGSSWTTVGTLAAAGNSTTKLSYNFTDNTPAKGINFYRLKLVDADNKFSNSDIRSVLFSNADVVLITPNPASSFVNIYMSKNNNSLTQIIVTDANGKMIERIMTAEQTYQLKTSGYAKGLYIIRIAGAENTSTQKVIIQ